MFYPRTFHYPFNDATRFITDGVRNRTMPVANEPDNHIQSYRYIFDKASYPYLAIGICIGGPIIAYLTGSLPIIFYAHVTLVAFWFGLDFFIEYVLAPAMDNADSDTTMGLIPSIQPNIMVFGEVLTVGTILSGSASPISSDISLTHRFGYGVHLSSLLYCWYWHSFRCTIIRWRC